jgi:hypothetical protein
LPPYCLYVSTPLLIKVEVYGNEGYQSNVTLTCGEINPLVFANIAVSIERLLNLTVPAYLKVPDWINLHENRFSR